MSVLADLWDRELKAWNDAWSDHNDRNGNITLYRGHRWTASFAYNLWRSLFS